MLQPNLARALAKGTVMSCFYFYFHLFIHFLKIYFMSWHQNFQKKYGLPGKLSDKAKKK